MNMQSHEQVEYRSSVADLAVSATIHCLIGCAIGEIVGLTLGVMLGWSVLTMIVVATAFAFITGFLLTLIPLMGRVKLSIAEAFRIVWLGETISIGVMEIAMNAIDYVAGGMNVTSIVDPVFWSSFVLALIAGFLAGYPVNYLMIKTNLKTKWH